MATKKLRPPLYLCRVSRAFENSSFVSRVATCAQSSKKSCKLKKFFFDIIFDLLGGKTGSKFAAPRKKRLSPLSLVAREILVCSAARSFGQEHPKQTWRFMRIFRLASASFDCKFERQHCSQPNFVFPVENGVSRPSEMYFKLNTS